MTKQKAIEYLVKNSVYSNEWQGAGMWEAVENVMNVSAKDRKLINYDWLDMLLTKALNK